MSLNEVKQGQAQNLVSVSKSSTMPSGITAFQSGGISGVITKAKTIASTSKNKTTIKETFTPDSLKEDTSDASISGTIYNKTYDNSLANTLTDKFSDTPFSDVINKAAGIIETAQDEKQFGISVQQNLPDTYNKNITLYKDTTVKLYSNEGTTFIKAGDIENFFSKNSNVNVERITTINNDVIWRQPTESEFISAYKSAYLQTGYVPKEVKRQVIIPSEVEFLGLSNLFVKESFEDYLGLNITQEQFQSQRPKDFVGAIYYQSDFDKTFKFYLKNLPVTKGLEFAKNYYLFGEKGLTYEELKKTEGTTVANISLLSSIVTDENISDIIKTKEWQNLSGFPANYNKNFWEYKGDTHIRQLVGTEVKSISEKKGNIFLSFTPVSYSDYDKAQETVAKLVLTNGDTDKWFESLATRTRFGTSVGEAISSAVTFPITLPQMAVKYATGSGNVTDVFGRVGSGKTLLLPDVGKYFGELKVTPVQGAVSGFVGEGIEKIGGVNSDFFKYAQKYPWETIAATSGEILALYVGGMSVKVAKSYTISGLGKIRSGVINATGWNVPGYTSFLKYSPINLLRTAKWKTLEYFGRAQEISPETVFQTSALPNQLSFAPGSTPSQRINALVNAFESGKGVTGYDAYTGVHTTTSAWYKPYVWLHKGRESPGVSFAPFGEGSPRFLRIGINNSYVSSNIGGMSILPQIKMPTSPLLYFEKIIGIPKRFAGNYESANMFLKESGAGVYIAPKMYLGGGEYEVIAKGWASRTGTRFFTRIEGVTIPMPEFTMVNLSPMKNLSYSLGSNIKNFVGISSSYNATSRIPIINPSYLSTKIISPSYSFKSYTHDFPRINLAKSNIDYSLSKSFIPSLNISSYNSSTIGSSISKSSNVSSVISNVSSNNFSMGSSIISYKPSVSSYNFSSYKPSISKYKSSYHTPYSNIIIPDVPYPLGFVKLQLKNGHDKGWVDKLFRKRYRFREFNIPNLNKILSRVKT